MKFLRSRFAWFLIVVNGIIFAIYEAPLFTYAALRAGLFDRTITVATGISIVTNRGWTLSPFTGLEILFSREPVPEVVYFPLRLVKPWSGNEYVGVARIKNKPTSSGSGIDAFAEDMEIGGHKFRSVSKTEGRATTLAFANDLGIELRAPTGDIFSRAIRSIK
ncbi:MAG: hypothetical protein HYX63_18575 [Gammaproteobacteria bacterium]|nr:hypothetical protein [Gammaproteobacteria bacterium]